MAGGGGVAGSAQAPVTRDFSGPEAPSPLLVSEPSAERISDNLSNMQPHHRTQKDAAPPRRIKPAEIMAEFRKATKGYPEFPPGVVLWPGVWDRKGEEPVLRDLKAPVAELPEMKKDQARKGKLSTESLSDWA